MGARREAMLLLVFVFGSGIVVAAGLECQKRVIVWFAAPLHLLKAPNE
jgi:hypothetical protein